jgi:FkbM family methyltransferase
MRSRARKFAHRLGLDVTPTRKQPGYHRNLLLQDRGVDLVVDVGANGGAFGRSVRMWGYSGPLVSFEPVTEAHRRLAAVAAADGRWVAHRFALGAEDGTVTINVAGNDAESSSVLGMLRTHREAAPQATYIATEEVQQRTLDGLSLELLDGVESPFLKVDVQGYERAVLEGAQHSLSRYSGVALELSFAPLYDGGMLYDEAFDRMREAGLAPVYIEPIFVDPRTGRMLQADALFMRLP